MAAKIERLQDYVVKRNARELMKELDKVLEPARTQEFFDRLPEELQNSCRWAKDRSIGSKLPAHKAPDNQDDDER